MVKSMAQYAEKPEPVLYNTGQEVTSDRHGKVVVTKAKPKAQEQKNRYFEIRVLKTENGTEYSYCFEKTSSGFTFYNCERTEKGKSIEDLTHYAYVSNEKAIELARELKRLRKIEGLDRESLINQGIKLIDNLRDPNYKDSEGYMVYVTNDLSNIFVSSVSNGRPQMHPKYVLPGEDPSQFLKRKL